MKNLVGRYSLKAKLVTSFLILGILPALIISGFTWSKSVDSLTHEAAVKLSTIRDIKAVQIESLFTMMESQVRAQSANALTIEAMQSFADAFKNYAKENGSVNRRREIESSLSGYYLNQFGRQYQSTNGGTSATGLTQNLNMLSDNSKALQYTYISANPQPLGEKDSLMNSADRTAWSKLHAKYHSSFREYLYEFGYYDIFLVDIDTGFITYSVFKELDFATSLKTGPFAKSGLGQAFRMAAAASEKNFVGITDMDRYFPSYDAPAGFISSPIFDDKNKPIGVLIFQIPVEKINAIMTNDGKWRETGFGESGETYLVGKDKKMRSMSRFLAEDPNGYFNLVNDKLPKEDIAYIKAKETTVIIQPVDTQGVTNVINTGAGFEIFADYRDINVLSAYKPLEINGLDWYLMSEMDEDEALSSINELTNMILIILLISIVVIVAFSIFFSANLTRPINSLTQLMKEVEETGNFSLRTVNSSADEVGQSGRAFNSLMDTLQACISDVNKVMGELSEGNFSRRVEIELKGDLEQLKTATNSSLDSVDLAMGTLSDVIGALGTGVFTRRMIGDFKGEFHGIQSSVNNALDGLEQAINEINRVMSQVASNNLTDRISVDLPGDLNILKEAVNKTVKMLAETLQSISVNARQVASASSETSLAIGQITDGAQNQLHAMSQVAAAVSQSSQAVNDVSEDMLSASECSKETVSKIVSGQEKVAQMVQVVNEISRNSTNINKITEVIGSIANQTNMLSLNAAIEAARAGEHGAGFAVVADEVRKLAERSASSAQEITSLVDQAVREAANAVVTAEEVSSDMDVILKSSGVIDDMVRRVATSMEQQSVTVQEINSNVESIKRVAEDSAAASEEITATVLEVSRLADGVCVHVNNFQFDDRNDLRDNNFTGDTTVVALKERA